MYEIGGGAADLGYEDMGFGVAWYGCATSWEDLEDSHVWVPR